MKNGIRISLSAMRNCLNERQKRINDNLPVDDNIKDIDSFYDEIDCISTNGNVFFTTIQRSDYLNMTNEVKQILNNQQINKSKQ